MDPNRAKDGESGQRGCLKDGMLPKQSKSHGHFPARGQSHPKQARATGGRQGSYDAQGEEDGRRGCDAWGQAGRRWEKRMTCESHKLDGVMVLDEVDGSSQSRKNNLGQ
jgi:hypothetical protein